MSTMRWYEVIWTVDGEDHSTWAYDTREPRIVRQIHGGTLRIDECEARERN